VRLDRQLLQLCDKRRLLEIIHDFILFEGGTKSFAVTISIWRQASQEFATRHDGGIIWHTQGSGKSLTMVWLAKWIREHITDARVLVLTDRTELG